ncbi:MAG TPA: hypothetical protein DCE56_07605, partial [Cyanobacteria bacterium UBA8553]|nr:hypothetical protein [Cyanobacteria bacterium UBA8553]
AAIALLENITQILIMKHSDWLRLQSQGENICATLRQPSYICRQQTQRLSWKLCSLIAGVIYAICTSQQRFAIANLIFFVTNLIFIIEVFASLSLQLSIEMFKPRPSGA